MVTFGTDAYTEDEEAFFRHRDDENMIKTSQRLKAAEYKIELKDTALDTLNEQNKALCLELYTANEKIKRFEGLAERLVEQIPFTLNPQYEYDRKLQGGWCAHCHKNEGDGHKENCNVGKFEEFKSELAKLKGCIAAYENPTKSTDAKD